MTQTKMADGCCSAISPCSHQQRAPTTICDVCARAAMTQEIKTTAVSDPKLDELADITKQLLQYGDRNNSQLFEAYAADVIPALIAMVQESNTNLGTASKGWSKALKLTRQARLQYSEEKARAMAAEAKVVKLQEERKRLDRRIHNQRRALRLNWEIIEARAGSHRPWPRDVRSNFLAHWTNDARRRKAAEARVKELEQELMDRDAFSEEYFDRAMAAEARVKELEAALDKIVRGQYDGLEVTHYSANECRNIARAALRR